MAIQTRLLEAWKLIISLSLSCSERRSSPVVRTLAYHAAGPGSIPGIGGENY